MTFRAMTGRDAPSTARHAEAGFTLIEMLVALAILALMTALIATSIGMARKALSFVEVASSEAPVAAAQSYVHAAIVQARPVQRAGVTTGRELGFAGTSEAVSFITSYGPRGQYDGLYRVVLARAPSPDHPSRFDLVVTQSLYRPPSGGSEPPFVTPASALLIENITGLSFSYFAAAEDGSGPLWQDSWSALDQLPALVAIDVAFAPGDARKWQRMTIPTYAASSSGVPCRPRTPCQ